MKKLHINSGIEFFLPKDLFLGLKGIIRFSYRRDLNTLSFLFSIIMHKKNFYFWINICCF